MPPTASTPGEASQGVAPHAPASRLEIALQLAGRGWRVFPCHTPVRRSYDTDAGCSCGRAACKDEGKHPRIKAWQVHATTNTAQICAWWTRWPDANVAIATGGGLIVVDLDGRDEVAAFARICAGRLPPCPTVTTARGFHLYLAGELDWTGKVPIEGLSTLDGKPGGVLVRGSGGYVIAPGSLHKSGHLYRWVKAAPLPSAPPWFLEWIAAGRKAKLNGHFGGDVPLWVQNRPAHIPEFKDGDERAGRATEFEWMAANVGRIRAALAQIPADCDRDTWLRAGMALHSLGWESADGGNAGFELWREWSETGRTKFAGLHDLETVWKSFRRGGVNIGTLFALANQQAAPLSAAVGGPVGPIREEVMPPENQRDTTPESCPPTAVNGSGGTLTVFQPITDQRVGPTAHTKPMRWADVDKTGPRPTTTNAAIALQMLGISCRKDVFHEQMLIAGEPIDAWAGSLTDDVVYMLRAIVKERFGFDAGTQNMHDAAVQLCLANRFDPVAQYLDGLTWDNLPRIDRWVVAYLGAPPTRLNCEIGRLMLIAAVRRAREPGTKFDQIIVLEGTEGRGKSTAMEILAGAENFSDQHVLGTSDREQQEAVRGVWIHEIAELTGMRRTEVERIKQFASRKEDRARPAYGRARVDMKRRVVFVATTNNQNYLQSETGNRRFWPVETSHIDLAGLGRDRDQLWAEAAVAEAQGVSIVLRSDLWEAAGEAQRERLESDPWEELVGRHVDKAPDVSIHEVLTGEHMKLGSSELSQAAMNRVARILLKFNFERYNLRVGGRRQWRYRRRGTGGTGT